MTKHLHISVLLSVLLIILFGCAGQATETGPEKSCTDDGQCWCKKFTGAEFVPGKESSWCCKEKGWLCPKENKCSQCIYD